MDRRRLIIGLILLVAIFLYVWIAYFEIPKKVKIGEDSLQHEVLIPATPIEGLIEGI